MSDDLLRIASIAEESIVDGPGLRLTVFTQGCPHHCPGCHNPATHNPNGGRLIKLAEIVEMYKENPLLAGITFSGGEPFCQPDPLAILGEKIRQLGGNVVTYTGYWFDDLLKGGMAAKAAPLLEVTDILIDGPYMENLRSLELRFRGSSNQRILNRAARRSLAAVIQRFAA